MAASVRLIRCRRPIRGSDIMPSSLRLFVRVPTPADRNGRGCVYRCVSTCVQTTNEIWITATEIWIISIPPTSPSASRLERLDVMFYVSLLSFVPLCFSVSQQAQQRFPRGKERSQRGASGGISSRRGLQCAAHAVLRPPGFQHDEVRPRNSSIIYTQTSPSSRLLRRGLSKCTFPLDELIMQSREQMLKSKCLLNASHKVSEWSALALISPERQAPSSATRSRRKKSRYSWTIDN